MKGQKAFHGGMQGRQEERGKNMKVKTKGREFGEVEERELFLDLV